MEYILVERGSSKPHDLSEVLIDIPEFSRWTRYHSDTIRALERKKLIQRIPGKGFIADYLFSYLLASTANEVHRNRIKAWKSYLEFGEAIPDQLYVESDQERAERQAAEYEASKSPATRLMEAESELAQLEQRISAANSNIRETKEQIGHLMDYVQRLESNLTEFDQLKADLKAKVERARQVYEESRKPFLQQAESSEEVAPIVVSEEDRLDISHKKRTSKR
jgi:flagellar biosynthesis chaperone FliJ